LESDLLFSKRKNDIKAAAATLRKLGCPDDVVEQLWHLDKENANNITIPLLDWITETFL
jgi:hypothetical protein